MATQGPNSPATASSQAFGGYAWSNPSNATASDNTRASCVIPAYSQTNYLVLSNFGFSVPTGATIDGITVEIEGYNVTSVYDNTFAALFKTIYSSATGNQYAPTPSSESYITVGHAADKWGTTWTATEVNASTFGVRIFTGDNDNAGKTCYIDHVRITVDYTPPAVATGGMFMFFKKAWDWLTGKRKKKQIRIFRPEPVLAV